MLLEPLDAEEFRADRLFGVASGGRPAPQEIAED
jgi:hypothetical protein